MAKAKEFLVALPIEEMRLGSAYPNGQSLPLHCTLMHWFGLGTSFVYLSNVLLELADSTDEYGIELVSKRAALFGPNNDVPVHILERNEKLNILHTRLFKFLARSECELTELRWTGAGYRPHVTDVMSRSFPPGTKYRPDGLVLVSRGKDKTKHIVREYKFGEIPF